MLKLFLVLTITLNPQTQIKALKLKAGEKVLEEGAFIKAKDFILLKNSVESGKCKSGLDACISACNEQIELILHQCKSLEPLPIDNQILIKALKYELEEKNSALKNTKQKASFYLYTSVGLALFTVGSFVWMYTTHK